MNQNLKPVKCGCGGEAVLHKCENGYYWKKSYGYCVECIKCKIKTIVFQTKTEALKAWDTAMSRKVIVPEFAFFRYYCPECGQEVDYYSRDKFCPECGSCIDWSDDE